MTVQDALEPRFGSLLDLPQSGGSLVVPPEVPPGTRLSREPSLPEDVAPAARRASSRAAS
jgi:hypothetical protein